MCGIAGILRIDGERVQEEMLSRMNDSLAHRGPDADGIYINGSIGLAHRRLSIIDLSEEANQPFVDSSGRFRVIFNGELYNYKEVRKRISHCKFRTNSDTETLIEAFASGGIDSLKLFKGMFAFAIWDSRENQLFLVRDRLGVKPLYYYKTDKFFVFASECRAILASGMVPAKLNQSSLIDYLSLQSVYSPNSLVEGICQLEAGHWLSVRDSNVLIAPYWSVENQDYNFDYTDTAAVKTRTRQLLRDSVEKRLVSDVPVGAFLSGGIDSSAVVGLMAEISPEPPNTFSIGFGERDFDESHYAKIVADKFKTNHHSIQLRPKALLDELENALNAMDSPSGDGINSYVVSKAVKSEGISVALSGIGGDELFAGYPFFKQYHKLRSKPFIWQRTSMLRKLLSKSGFWKNGPRAAKMRDLLRTDHLSIASLYPIFRSVVNDNEIKEILHQQGIPQNTISRKLLEKNSRIEKYPLLSQVSIAEFLGYTQQTLLKDTDQMSMAFALEVREPFFDDELISFVLNIPDKIKYPHYPKQLLVESLGGLLPDEIVHRKKQGFVFPWSSWMKNELKSFCGLRMERLAERSYFNGNTIRRYWFDFLKGDRNIKWIDIWLLVVLEYWMSKNAIE
jgi:asparagine synthase (glutamine-hydrolysing)